MVTFILGPAANVRLTLDRTPIVLRVVRSAGVPDKWDALNHLGDAPTPVEEVFVYLISHSGVEGTAFVDGRDKVTGGRKGWQMTTARYFYSPLQPTDAEMRDNDLWDAWTNKNRDALLAARQP